MSSTANLSSTQSAFPLANLHAHGHKKGAHVESTDGSTSDTSTQIPVGAAQNVFGNLLRTLEQVVGVQLTTAPAATNSGAGITASTTAATASTASAGAATAQSASALLQNYLNNLQNPQASVSQTPKLAGSSIRVNA
jgi:hypothetical protein